MLTKFWDSIGEKLADKWVAQALGPALVFWAGGLLAWASRFGWAKLDEWFTKLNPTEQLAVLVGSFLLIAASSAAVEVLVFPILRLLEGYWPSWVPGRGWLVRRKSYRIKRDKCHWQTLDLKKRHNTQLTVKEEQKYAELDAKLRLVPVDEKQLKPTRLGNILRSAEERPANSYGLIATVCWPRLWLLLPDGVKTELSAARSAMDTAIRIMIWSMLFLIWGVWVWWAFVAGLLVAFFAYYFSALSAAEVYGDLLEATFDLHRMKLYRELRWPAPTDPDSEKAHGKQLSEYLFRGIGGHPEKYIEEKERE
jgi:hypothetical protein